MTNVQEKAYRVSSRGQLSFPASARHRWGIVDGGDVEVFDLGDAVVILPGGARSAKRSLAAALTGDRYDDFVRTIDDAELRDE